MQCPVDGTKLKISDKDGIEIDYCPQCRGVWLDRGELEKIIERANQHESRSRQYDDDERHGRRRNDRGDDEEEGGFLGNLFGGFGRRDD